MGQVHTCMREEPQMRKAIVRGVFIVGFMLLGIGTTQGVTIHGLELSMQPPTAMAGYRHQIGKGHWVCDSQGNFCSWYPE